MMELAVQKRRAYLHLQRGPRTAFSLRASVVDPRIWNLSQDNQSRKNLILHLICDVLQACELELILASGTKAIDQCLSSNCDKNAVIQIKIKIKIKDLRKAQTTWLQGNEMVPKLPLHTEALHHKMAIHGF
jgi:hypothetical protein